MSFYVNKANNLKRKVTITKHLQKINEEQEDLDASYIINQISTNSVDNDSKNSKSSKN